MDSCSDNHQKLFVRTSVVISSPDHSQLILLSKYLSTYDMNERNLKSSRLFFCGVLDPKDELDESLEKCHGELSALTANLRENEVYNHVSEKVNRSAQDHENITMALLYSILTEPTTAPKTFHTLTLITRDGMTLITGYMEMIIMEKMSKLQDTTRVQILWMIREMVQTKVDGADKLCFALLKQLPAGSTSSSDIYISEYFMHIMLDNREWLESQPALVTSVVYTYLSLIPSHMGASLTSFREQETQLCVSLIRNKFMDCVQIGRDLLRLLQAVARIPEFTQLWKDMIENPQSLSPQFTGVQQILSKRTSRRFIAGRVLADVEIKLNFLLSKVKFGQHKRYQEWFQRKYLSSSEGHHQIPELMRYVCCVIHPPNELLCSDIFPRWALIGWLMSLCQSNPVAFSGAKLTLFYDWLGYNMDADNIMNIEPGILLMFHSLRSHPQFSATLLDFLCRMIPSYCPSLEQVVATGVKTAFRDILQKGVLLSLEPLFESPKWDEELKSLVRKTFPEFSQQAPESCVSVPPSVLPSQTMRGGEDAPPSQAGGGEDAPPSQTGGGEDAPPSQTGGREGSEDAPLIITSDEELEGEDAEVTCAFSDTEEGEEEVSLLPSNSQGFVAITVEEEDSPWSRVAELPGRLREKLLALREDRSSEEAVKILQEFLDLLKEDCNKDAEGTVALVAAPLAECLSEDFDQGCVTQTSDMDTTDFERPTHYVMRHISSSPVLSPLAATLRQHQSKLGYFYLHYLYSSSRPEESKLFHYKDFARHLSLEVKDCLLQDMKECVETEPAVFYSLLPGIYNEFHQSLIGCDEMLNLIVANVDPAQLHSLILQLMTRELQIFGKDPDVLRNVIHKSLHWDSFEQFCFWQLLSAEGPDCVHIIPALSTLNPEEHPEAISSALLFLKTESTVYGAIGALLSLPEQHSDLVDTVASRWINGRPTKYARYLSQFLETLHKGSDDKGGSLATLMRVCVNLERVVMLLNSKHILEASELSLAKNLLKIFNNHPQLESRCKELHTIVSELTGSTKKESAPSKKKVNPGDKRSTKLEPKPKKRRVVNKEDLVE